MVFNKRSTFGASLCAALLTAATASSALPVSHADPSNVPTPVRDANGADNRGKNKDAPADSNDKGENKGKNTKPKKKVSQFDASQADVDRLLREPVPADVDGLLSRLERISRTAASNSDQVEAAKENLEKQAKAVEEAKRELADSNARLEWARGRASASIHTMSDVSRASYRGAHIDPVSAIAGASGPAAAMDRSAYLNALSQDKIRHIEAVERDVQTAQDAKSKAARKKARASRMLLQEAKTDATTIRKAKNRFKSLDDKFGGLLADGTVDYGDTPQVDYGFTDQEIRVVDISACNTNVQELIVTSTISAIWKLAEKSEMGVDKLIIFVDELNKYAPAGGEGGLRDTLVDIAARGRHLNVVLLGAQQFRSKIDGEILGNCGTSFYGRVGDEEIINAAYRSISDTSKQELLGLAKGRLLVRHAHFRAPLFGTFPLPPTIPGINGQRVFGKEGGVINANATPADPIFRMLQRYMGDRAPGKSEVINECEGLDRDDIEEARTNCELIFRNDGKPKTNHWQVTRKQLATRRSIKAMS